MSIGEDSYVAREDLGTYSVNIVLAGETAITVAITIMTAELSQVPQEIPQASSALCMIKEFLLIVVS